MSTDLSPLTDFPTISLPLPDICSVESLSVAYKYSYFYILLLISSFPLLFIISAPYGKLKKSTWTIDISYRLGWFIMEAPGWITHIIISFIVAPQIIHTIKLSYSKFSIPILSDQNLNNINDVSSPFDNIVPPQINLYILIVFFSAIFYNCHYFYRSIIYPRMAKSSKTMDLVPVLMASIFNVSNGLVQSYGSFCILPQNVTHLDLFMYTIGHLGFCLCWFGCFWSDKYLISLRSSSVVVESEEKEAKKTIIDQNDTISHYTIPTKGLFRITYSANYLCEFFQWGFFAMMILPNPFYYDFSTFFDNFCVDNLLSLDFFDKLPFLFDSGRMLFVCLTFSNLFPRAVQYRAFYKELALKQGKIKNE
jgi:hypothetical protein